MPKSRGRGGRARGSPGRHLRRRSAGSTSRSQILRDAIELPYLHPEVFAEHQLQPPKGILLYGPPGCGKTLIAKAVANALAKRIEERTGRQTTAYFLNVKGPELLNKYVGETEHKIREVFKRAREKASEDVPVVIFFDEMDSLFRMRGSGISSDMEATVVAQFLSEIDGVESLKNVIVIGASNRQDLIDPAVLRPGRLDLKVKVSRPDKQAAYEIFTKYLTPDLPFHRQAQERYGSDRSEDRRRRCSATRSRRCTRPSDENKFLEVTYAKGEREIFYFKDFSSGAMIENIVARAKKMAVKRLIDTGERGIQLDDLHQAVRDEFKENEDLPNTTNPDDWARISGRKGERIINVRTLITGISRKRAVDREHRLRAVPVGRRGRSPVSRRRWSGNGDSQGDGDGDRVRDHRQERPRLRPDLELRAARERVSRGVARRGSCGTTTRRTRSPTRAASRSTARSTRRTSRRTSRATRRSRTARATTSTTRTPSTRAPR